MQRSEFIGFDMLAEPPPRWPDWLERWYREARPKPASAWALSDEVRKLFTTQALENQLRSSVFTILLRTSYHTPKAIERRVAQRAANRMPRD